jgi:hypothetical protein
MLLTANRDVARAFCTNYALFQSFVLSVDLQRGVKLAERQNTIIDIGTAAYVHHERMHNARL